MYPAAELAAAEGRLRDFLIYRLGGPDRYIIERGHPRLRIRHAPFVINQAARNRWFELMCHAMDGAQLPPEVDASLRAFFAETSTFLLNHDS